MKKICFFSGDITRSGGTERVATGIMNGLCETKNYQIIVVSLTEAASEPFFHINPSINRFKLGNSWKKPGPGYLIYPSKLKKILQAEHPDVIIDIDIVLDIIAIPAVKNLNIKVISWEHFNYAFEIGVTYRKIILKHFLPKSNCLVTLTQGDSKAFAKNISGIKKTCYIYNPVSVLQQKGLHNSNQIIWSGRLTYQKGTDYLVDVAEKVLMEHPDWQWIVLGDGEDRDKLEKKIRERKLDNRLILAGRVNNVIDYLNASKLFVLTSVYEGLPMCLLEAKASGLPCVSFDCPTGPSEILENGCDGYLIPCFDTKRMAETINSLISDTALLQKLAENSEKNMDRFSFPLIIKQWDELINDILLH